MTKPQTKPRTLLKTAIAAVAMIATTIVGGASSPVEASKSCGGASHAYSMVGVHSPAYFFYSGGRVYQKWNRVVLEADNKVHTYGYGSVLCPYL